MTISVAKENRTGGECVRPALTGEELGHGHGNELLGESGTRARSGGKVCPSSRALPCAFGPENRHGRMLRRSGAVSNQGPK